MSRKRKDLKPAVRKARRARVNPRRQVASGPYSRTGEAWYMPTPAEAEVLAQLFGTTGKIVGIGMSDNLTY